MVECEDCKEECPRRIRCPRCDGLVCPWCWHHVHGPGLGVEPSYEDGTPAGPEGGGDGPAE